MLLELAGVAGLAWAALHALRRLSRHAGRRRRDPAGLPPELHGAPLVWSEKVFRCGGPTPMVARIDRAYRGPDGRLTLVEFKRRDTCRVRPSDVVELSAQRFVLQRAGHPVNVKAYVIVLDAEGTAGRALAVVVEDMAVVERRMRRLLAIIEGRAVPDAPSSPFSCRRCGHRDVCPRVRGRAVRGAPIASV
jgi:hypothetical protein